MIIPKLNRICLLILIACIGLLSCEKDDDIVYDAIDELAEKYYYESEIFDDPYLDIYGQWKCYDISGGWTDQGYEVDFDLLKIKRFGIYGFLRNDSILEYGYIRIDTLINTNLIISFVPDENSDLYLPDPEKWVHFFGEDTLFLPSPCCDRYDFHFVRE